MDEYIKYLQRTANNGKDTLWEIHQRALSREVAKEYGLTDEEILKLDSKLVEGNDNEN